MVLIAFRLRMSMSGIRFTDAHAVDSTSTPSRYSLFTGHYAWRRNDTGVTRGDAGMVIRPEQTTIADIIYRIYDWSYREVAFRFGR